MSTAAREIREAVARYLSGVQSLAELESWIVPATWQPDDPEALGLAKPIKLLLAEYLAGHRHESEVRAGLESIVNPHAGHVEAVADSASMTQEADLVMTIGPVDIRAQVAYV
jgi:hypothetical protein